MQNIVNKSNVSIVSHDIIRFPIPLEEIIEIAIAQKADHYARFDQLSVTYLYDNNKLISPTGYLDVNPDDVKEHSLYLDSIEIEARKKIQKLKILPLSYLYGKNHMEVNLEERKLDLDS